MTASAAKFGDYLIMPGGKIKIPPWHKDYQQKTKSLPGKRINRDLFDPLA